MSSFEKPAQQDVSATASGNEEHATKPSAMQSPGTFKEARQQLRRANRRLIRQREQIAALRARLARKEAGGKVEGIKPENIIWIFGSGRTGSTWLSDMMKVLPNHARWNEPTVGYLFGRLYYERKLFDQDKENFILSDGFRETWQNSIRSFVLDGATARYPELVEKEGYLVIKEPHGSRGAPLLMEALPESRMVFLVRDPRDVVASTLHTTLLRDKVRTTRPELYETAKERPDEWVRNRSNAYFNDITRTKQAYQAHDGHKVLVRYEDLKADTMETIKRIYSALEILVEEGELARAVEKYAIENIPEHKKGAGTVRRRATSGGWREDLTPKQAEIVGHVTAPILQEFYEQ